MDSDVIERREALAPVMSELGVDAVLAGHDHIYTRSYLMEGMTPSGDLDAQENGDITLYPTEEQVLYVTANSSTGSKYYGIDDRSPDAAIKHQSNEPQYTDVDVTLEALTFTTYHTHDGQVVDKVTIARDVAAPVFVGIEDAEVAQGSDFDPRSGIIATDDISGDLTDEFIVDGDVDTTTPGEYTITYRVSDLHGNETEVTRTVVVLAVAPVLTGIPESFKIEAGDSFDPLAGVTAIDANGNDITSEVEVVIVPAESATSGAAALAVSDATTLALSQADYNQPGEYAVIYAVTDEFGSSSAASAALTVTEASTVPPGDDDDNSGSDDSGDNGTGPDDSGGGDNGASAGSGSSPGAGSDALPTTGGEFIAILVAALVVIVTGVATLRRSRSTTV